MAVLRVASLLIAACALLDVSADSTLEQLTAYEGRNSVIYDLLVKECPNSFNKRHVLNGHQPVDLEVEKEVYAELIEKLKRCLQNRQGKIPSTTTTAATTNDYLKKCKTALKLTDFWRQDFLGRDLKAGAKDSKSAYACDRSIGNRWFTFTGLAGNKMLDFCPRSKSCGTKIPYWTDEAMPTQVGVEKTIKAYGEENGKCKAHEKTIKVMKCSVNNNDFFIYQQFYIDAKKNETCNEAFCGTA